MGLPAFSSVPDHKYSKGGDEVHFLSSEVVRYRANFNLKYVDNVCQQKEIKLPRTDTTHDQSQRPEKLI
eukprot:gene4284-5358_t